MHVLPISAISHGMHICTPYALPAGADAYSKSCTTAIINFNLLQLYMFSSNSTTIPLRTHNTHHAGNISFSELWQLWRSSVVYAQRSVQLTLTLDCCFSGQWVQQLIQLDKSERSSSSSSSNTSSDTVRMSVQAACQGDQVSVYTICSTICNIQTHRHVCVCAYCVHTRFLVYVHVVHRPLCVRNIQLCSY
jgi:hypothetical protein